MPILPAVFGLLMCFELITADSYLSGNANIKPASAEEIEKAITAAQAKISQATSVLAFYVVTLLALMELWTDALCSQCIDN